jgi:hypothetical protein
MSVERVKSGAQHLRKPVWHVVKRLRRASARPAMILAARAPLSPRPSASPGFHQPSLARSPRVHHCPARRQVADLPAIRKLTLNLPKSPRLGNYAEKLWPRPSPRMPTVRGGKGTRARGCALANRQMACSVLVVLQRSRHSQRGIEPGSRLRPMVQRGGRQVGLGTCQLERTQSGRRAFSRRQARTAEILTNSLPNVRSEFKANPRRVPNPTGRSRSPQESRSHSGMRSAG